MKRGIVRCITKYSFSATHSRAQSQHQRATTTKVSKIEMK